MKNNSINSFLNKNGFVKIPLTKNKLGHFLLKAKINSIAGKFILDTGASTTVIDDASAEKFNLKLMNKKIKNAGGLGTAKIKVRQSRNNRVELNNFTADKIKISILDLSHVNKTLTNNGAGIIDGVIGADIMRNYNAVIDYNGKALYLKKDK